jgi:hypothetical protein
MSEIDMNAPEVQTAIQEATRLAVAEATLGLEQKNKQLLGETKAEREQRRTAETRLGGFEGVDLEEYKALKGQQEAAVQKKAEDKGQYEELMAANSVKHKGELEASQSKSDNYRDKFYEKSMDSEIRASLEKEEGSATLLMPAIKARLKTEEVDGELVIVALDSSGKPMFSEDGKPGTVSDVVKHLKTIEEYQPAFKATRIMGSGSITTKSGVAVGANPWKKETRNLTEQGRLMTENPALAAQFKNEAGAR